MEVSSVADLMGCPHGYVSLTLKFVRFFPLSLEQCFGFEAFLARASTWAVRVQGSTLAGPGLAVKLSFVRVSMLVTCSCHLF